MIRRQKSLKAPHSWSAVAVTDEVNWVFLTPARMKPLICEIVTKPFVTELPGMVCAVIDACPFDLRGQFAGPIVCGSNRPYAGLVSSKR